MPVLKAGIAAKVNYKWLASDNYPKCTIAESEVRGELGPMHQWTVEYSGLKEVPNLRYVLRKYKDQPFADLLASVINVTGKTIEVEDIRSVATNNLQLDSPLIQTRVLSDSFSEDRPAMRVRDIADAPQQMHRAVGSQLIYDRQSHRSFFIGALSSDRFLTILRLHIGGTASAPSIQNYEVDATGTTEMNVEESLLNAPQEDRIELSLPIKPGESLQGERLLLGITKDPHLQLETYGNLIRILHHPRPVIPTPMGWWSWTSYYFGLNEGAASTNAQWMAQNLKSLGFDFFHIDEGYQYSRGEYTTADASLFPHGMMEFERSVLALGLTPGLWTAPFEVGKRSWVYENHQDWLLRNAQGNPIALGSVGDKEPIYVLDVTHPKAQQYLHQTYTTMARRWGIKYFKLDFMEDSAIEGHYFRPHTTALEAQRIGLGILREAVGDSVLLDKDGSPMLNPVGYADLGRISQDTGHSFAVIKEAATGIAARYYMNHNFYTSDPDAFSVSALVRPQNWHGGEQPLTLEEAQISIALAAVSGGMYEIGDDLPTLGRDPERLTLVKKPDLLDMVHLGRSSIPIDLLDYLPEDEQPSIFYLHEDPNQSILTIFNWTEKTRARTIDLSQFGFPGANTTVLDVFSGKPLPLTLQGSVVVEQPAHSVRVLKFKNTANPPLRPSLTAQRLANGKVGEELSFSAASSEADEPALQYEWNFGDGVATRGATATHTFTAPGTYTVRVKANFLNGSAAEDSFQISISGTMNTQFDPEQKRRFISPEAIP